MIYFFRYTIICYFVLQLTTAQAQTVLSLQDAITQGVDRYQTIKSKGFNAEASKALASQARRDYLPNVVLSAQQDYGTVNGQNGPLYGYGGYSVASSGLPLDKQNWHAAFGALYLANVNWEFFTFGRYKERIKVAEAGTTLSERDLAQEQFQHQIRIAASYLNLLASQRLVRAQEKNLARAVVFKNTVVVRAKNGLIAGVDSALANAEVSNATIALIKTRDLEQEQKKNLAVLIGSDDANFILDSGFVARIPNTNAESQQNAIQHPVLSFYRSRVDLSLEQTKLIRKAYYPSFSFFGVVQKRASGFSSAYAQDQTAYTSDYLEGIKPTRTNYLLGAGLTWNITSIARSNAQAKAQSYTTLSNESDYQLVDQQLKAQYATAEQKLDNALLMYREAPIQVRAATDAYQQKSVLYKNGLSNIVEVTQTLYTLNRAETDRDIAYINVWQALLMKAAASGDLTLFKNEL